MHDTTMRRRQPASARHHSVLLPAVLFFVVAAGANDDPAILATVCGATPAANPEAFDISFLNTLEMIYQNVTRSGFGAAASGADNVFALGQCLAYLSPTDCQLCYAQSRVKLPHYLPATSGRIYLDGCFLRFGPDNFPAAATDTGDTAVCSNSDVAAVPARGFAVAAAALLRNVTAAARDRYYYHAS